MTNPIYNPQPNYSGVTIQITNPSVYAGNSNSSGLVNNQNVDPKGSCYSPYCQPTIGTNGFVTNPIQGIQNPQFMPAVSNGNEQNNIPLASYPAQYYLNNYNYQGNGSNVNDANGASELNKNISNDDKNSQKNIDENHSDKFSENTSVTDSVNTKSLDSPKNSEDTNSEKKPQGSGKLLNNYKDNSKSADEQDFSKSNAVIADLDERQAEIKAEQKNAKKKRVVALTDEYIKSLENYLNNPNDEIRLMASKEILKRLDEDKERYNDAALNALLNKMLQDPSKLIRIASLSAFSAELASGNDYTIHLLHTIQQNPSADKEDVLQAADILLKMSAGTEEKYIPTPNTNTENRSKK